MASKSARRNRIHANLLIDQLHRQRPGERDNRALGGRIVEQRGTAAIGSDRGRINDAAPTSDAAARPSPNKTSKKYWCERCMQLLCADVADRFLWMLLGSVIDQNIQAAELLDRLIDNVPAKRFLADIARDQQALAIVLLDQPFCFPGVVMFVEIDEQRRPRPPSRK